MKKVIIIIIIIFSILFVLKNQKNTISVMQYEDNKNINMTYYLDFKNETLSTNNFKIKLYSMRNNNFTIKRIYPKYNSYLKKYYTYDFSNIDNALDDFKNDYINLLRENNLFDEIDKVYKNGIIIRGIEIYTTKNNVDNYVRKYKNVQYKIIDENYSEM